MNMLEWSYVHTAKAAFEHMDDIRRRQGDMFDAAGFGPRETPYRVIHAEAGIRLRRYESAADKGPALLIVPAPIKRTYIWDMVPERSVVRRCLDQGMRVYLVEWTPASDAEHDAGLADYGDRLLRACLAAVVADAGQPGVILAGHSLGGTLATMLACLYPQQVRAMLLLEAPLHFGRDAGSFAPLVAATPDAKPIGDAFGKVPGSFLNLISSTAAPQVFQWERYIDWSLSFTDADALGMHMRVERWAHDEFPLPGKLFTDIVEQLYRDDQLMKGRLRLGDRQIGPQALKAPLLNVIDPRSTIIPPQSILPFHEAAASKVKKVLPYEGDIGVAIQHVGILVGRNAHAVIWPAIFDWLAEIGSLRRLG